MANEYISKQAVLNLPQSIERNLRGEIVERSIDVKDVEALKPADVVQVVHGRWVKYTGMGKEQWMCSECSAEEKNPKIARYCYYCGAKMDGERKE